MVMQNWKPDGLEGLEVIILYSHLIPQSNYNVWIFLFWKLLRPIMQMNPQVSSNYVINSLIFDSANDLRFWNKENGCSFRWPLWLQLYCNVISRIKLLLCNNQIESRWNKKVWGTSSFHLLSIFSFHLFSIFLQVFLTLPLSDGFNSIHGRNSWVIKKPPF